MNALDAARVLGHAAAFDNRKPSEAAATAWAAALPDIPADADAFAAVARFYGTPPKEPGERLWIQPHDVRTVRARIRAERVANFVYEPDGEVSAQEYLARLRSQLRAVASGAAAAPTQAPALEGGPHQRVAEALAGVGRTVPDTDEVKRPGPGGITCPKCHAAVGRPCRLPSGKERPSPHPARVGAATGGAR